MSTRLGEALKRIDVLDREIERLGNALSESQSAWRAAISALRSYDKPLAEHMQKRDELK